MSAPAASLFHGDINIEVGCDTNLYGFGQLRVANNITILGTTIKQRFEPIEARTHHSKFKI